MVMGDIDWEDVSSAGLLNTALIQMVNISKLTGVNPVCQRSIEPWICDIHNSVVYIERVFTFVGWEQTFVCSGFTKENPCDMGPERSIIHTDDAVPCVNTVSPVEGLVVNTLSKDHTGRT